MARSRTERRNKEPAQRGRGRPIVFDEPVQALVLRLPEALHAAVKELSRATGSSMNHLIVEAVREKYGRSK